MATDTQRDDISRVAREESEPSPLWLSLHRPSWMRLLNLIGGGLRRIGVDSPKLDSADLIATAERQARLSDWGDERFREGLEVLLRSFEEQDDLSTFGRFVVHDLFVHLLVNRLRIQDDLKRHPEILAVPIQRPLFITGFPRSGTTLLHRMLSMMPGGRPLLYWETREPSPPPQLETRWTDPRIARARKVVKGLYAMAPHLAAIHPFEAESPEECNPLFMHGFVAPFGFVSHVPGYDAWLRRQNLVGPYRYYRQQLQLLSWHCPGDPWVLKAPSHLGGLDALLTVFPDACVVLTHRNLLQVVPSACSLAAAFRGIFSDRVDLRQLGEKITESMATGIDRAHLVRATAAPSRFLDLSYPALLADPIGTVRDVCRYFGYPYNAEFENRLRLWLAENPQHKHGVHRYSLEQFGLNADKVNNRFANYREWMAQNLKPVP
jgi:hypothetical protein